MLLGREHISKARMKKFLEVISSLKLVIQAKL